MKKIVMTVICTLTVIQVFANSFTDTIYPEAGKPCPRFTLHSLKYANGLKEANNATFRGKWLVLDFWNKGCGACVASFPGINREVKEFKGRVQFILVGIQDKEKQIQPMYEKFRKLEHLDIPCAFDSTISNQWDIYTAPHIIVIDPQGIVRAVTSGLPDAAIKAFLAGETPSLPKSYRYQHEQIADNRLKLNMNTPFLTNGNMGADTAFLFRSLLSRYDPDRQQQFSPGSIDRYASAGKFEITGVKLLNLFNYAYYGKVWPDDETYHLEPVLEVRDSTFFKYSTAGNQFCYSLILPSGKATKEQMMTMMQRDLENEFGMTGVIEEREFATYKLVATDVARPRLATKGAKTKDIEVVPKMSYKLINYRWIDVVSMINIYFDNYLIDTTGITGNVDVDLIDMPDKESFKKHLEKQGLQLIPIQRKMKVLVIKDVSGNFN